MRSQQTVQRRDTSHALHCQQAHEGAECLRTWHKRKRDTTRDAKRRTSKVNQLMPAAGASLNRFGSTPCDDTSQVVTWSITRSTSRCQKEATKQGPKGRCSRHCITTSPRQRLGITELGQQWATTDLCAPCTGRRSPRGARSWTPRPTCRCTSAPRRPHLAPSISCTEDMSTYVHVCILLQQSATPRPTCRCT